MPVTRAKRQAQQQAGLPPSPQIVLPDTSRRRPRAKKARKAPAVPETSTTEHVEDPKSEIQVPFSSPVAHPVPEVASPSPITVPPGLDLANNLKSPIAHPVATRSFDAAAVFAAILQHPSSGPAVHPVPAKSPKTPTAQTVPAKPLCSSGNILPVPISTPVTLSQHRISAAEFPSLSRNVPPALPSTLVTPIQHRVSPTRVASSTTQRVSPCSASTLHIPAQPQTRLHLWVDAAPEDLAAVEPSNTPSYVLAIPSSLVPEILALIAQRPVTRSNKLTQTADSGSELRSLLKRKLSNDAEMAQPARRIRFGESKTPRPKASQSRRQALSEASVQPNSGVRASNTSHRRTKIQKLERYDITGNIQLGGTIEVPVDSDDEGMPFSPPLKENRSAKHHYASLEGTMVDGNPYREDERPLTPRPELVEDALFNPFTVEYETNRERSPVATVAVLEDQPSPGTQRDPATPRARRWGLGSILDSARSVSKYIPLLNTRPTVPAPQIAEDIDGNAHQVAILAQPLVQASPRTEPRPSTHSVKPGNVPATERARPSKRPQSNKPPARGALKSKQQIADERKRRAEREFMREQADFVRADDARKAHEARNRESVRHQVEKAATPGGKRKRQPSPDTIPNPPGVSYGMDLDYFCYSGSDEEEEQTTPIKQPPNKKTRISLPDSTLGPVIGDPHKARPYTGVYFADSAERYHGGNIFGETASSANAVSRAADRQQASMSLTSNEIAKDAASRAAAIGLVREGVQVTEAELIARGYLGNAPRVYIPGPPAPTTNGSITFKVPEPSDSDSDSDPEDPEPGVATPTAPGVTKNTSPPRISYASSPGQPVAVSSTAPSSTKAGGTWTQPPPPRPNPTHAILPTGSMDEDQLNDAIAKARANAMKHAPTKSSSLRQSSRLSSPRTITGNVEKQPVKSTGFASQESGKAREQGAPTKRQDISSAKIFEVPVATTAEVTHDTLLTTGIEPGANVRSGEVSQGKAHSTTLVKVSHVDETQISAQPHIDSVDRAPLFSVYEDWRRTADQTVSQLVESTWTEQDTEIAEDEVGEDLDAYFAAEDALEAELDAYYVTDPPALAGSIAKAATEEAEPVAFNKGKEAVYGPRPMLETAAVEDVGVETAVGPVTRTAEKDLAALDYTERLNSYATFMHSADPAVTDLLEKRWTDRDDGEAAESFDEEFDTFIAQQSVENATAGPSVAT